ncbi:uncharacterized protein LOC123005551 [Tribolium madens]|uniref:uncharacterized protein LOC123005551 n=1 Tax=Tribolium madens TaxID=41895 RepID=UPI001CF7655A|nr:uncharacterized protein LOC123005551 [Tribolium madens]
MMTVVSNRWSRTHLRKPIPEGIVALWKGDVGRYQNDVMGLDDVTLISDVVDSRFGKRERRDKWIKKRDDRGEWKKVVPLRSDPNLEASKKKLFTFNQLLTSGVNKSKKKE